MIKENTKACFGIRLLEHVANIHYGAFSVGYLVLR
jgi:hypothetical protein